jgi:hypothetical protein
MKTVETDPDTEEIRAVLRAAEAEMNDAMSDEQAVEIYVRHGVDERTAILLARMRREDIELAGQAPLESEINEAAETEEQPANI